MRGATPIPPFSAAAIRRLLRFSGEQLAAAAVDPPPRIHGAEEGRRAARSDAARLRGSYRYMTDGASPRRDLPLFDRLQVERS